MTVLVAYEPIAAHAADGAQPLRALTVNIGDGRSLDVVAVMTGADDSPPDGVYGRDGVIVIDSTRQHLLVDSLDGQPALKRTTVPGGIEIDPPLAVDPKFAGLSGAANEGRPVDRFGAPLDVPAPTGPPRFPGHRAQDVEPPRDPADRPDSLEGMTKRQLTALAEQRGIGLTSDMTKADIISSLGGEDQTPEQAATDTGSQEG